MPECTGRKPSGINEFNMNEVRKNGAYFPEHQE
jgi:hypothetical protein